MKKLNDLLKGNSKLCMLLMTAVANGCEKVIENTFKDDYLQNLVKTAATVKFDLSDSDKSMFAELMVKALEQEQDTLQNRCINIGSRINKLETAIMQNITAECNAVLEQLIELTELSRIDKISAEDARRLTLWFAMGQILHECDMCATTLNNASMYKARKKDKQEKQTAKKKTSNGKKVDGEKAKKKDKEPDYSSVSSDDIMAYIKEGTFKDTPWDEISDKVKVTVSGVKDFIVREFESLDDSDKVTTMKEFFECSNENRVSFAYNVLIVSLNDYITKLGDDANAFILDVLQFLPNIFIALTTSKADDVDVYKLIEDIGQLGVIQIDSHRHTVVEPTLERVSDVITTGIARLHKLQEKCNSIPAMQRMSAV